MRMLSVILFLGIAMLAFSERCPSKEDLHPCTCRNDWLTNNIKVLCDGYETNDLTLEDIRNPLKSLAGKVNVEILMKRVKLGTLPANFLKDTGVQKFLLEDCYLDSLSDGNQPILAGLEESLEVLGIDGSIQGNFDLSQLKFGHLIKLKELLLFNNNIKEVSNNWFDKGPASLGRVFLYGNGIEELGNNAFANLPRLRNLLVQVNTISLLERSMFPRPADNLALLALDYNKVNNLPEDIFSDMPQLKYLNLNSNEITRLDKETWESVWEYLQLVNFEGNPLICDSQMSWIFDLRAPMLTGTCAAPTSKKGIKLKDFINNKEE